MSFSDQNSEFAFKYSKVPAKIMIHLYEVI